MTVARVRRTSGPVLPRRALNRTLLARQGLLERSTRSPADVIERLVGLQAQEPADPYVGLWSRIRDFDPTVLSADLEARRAVRMGLMRTTLHLVTVEDAWRLAPVMVEVHRRIFRATPFAKALDGLDPEPVVAAARAALASTPMRPVDLGRHLAARFPDRDPSALAALARYHLPLVQVPPRGLWRRTGQATNTTLDAWTGRSDPAPIAVEELVRRYLAAFGPASVADVRTWSSMTGLREVVEAMRPGLRSYRDEAGRELLDVEDGRIEDPETPASVRFLPQYDNAFLAHDDRARINGALVWGLSFAWKGVVLVDGFVTGAWRAQRGRGRATMTIELGRALTREERRDLEDEGARLAAFLDPDLERGIVLVPPTA